MRQIAAATLFAAALFSQVAPAAAQDSYSWTGSNRLFGGATTNGCNLRLEAATHSGSLGLSNIFITIRNRGTARVRLDGTGELSGNNSRKSGPFSGLIDAGQTARIQLFTPGGSTLNGTVLRISVTACMPAP